MFVALEAVGAVGVQTRAGLSGRAAAVLVVVVAAAPILLSLHTGPALEIAGLALLLFQEEVHQQDLLLVDLEADVFGDVRYQPVHNVAHEHHDVLVEMKAGENVTFVLCL